jgi:predicted RNase H-like HicB family nuclease
MHFPVVIHKDDDSDFGVTIPDLPGCFSAGETIEEALDMAKDAILCHLEGLLIDDETIPIPCSIETYRGHPDYRDGIFAIVDVDISAVSGETQRINLTMPKRVLMRLDRYVASVGGNRSAVLTEAALHLTRSADAAPRH